MARPKKVVVDEKKVTASPKDEKVYKSLTLDLPQKGIVWISNS
jgi:hypothetical protein